MSPTLEIKPRPPLLSWPVPCRCYWNCQFAHGHAVQLLLLPAGLLPLKAAGRTDLGLAVVLLGDPSPLVVVSKADEVPGTWMVLAVPYQDTQVVGRFLPHLNFWVMRLKKIVLTSGVDWALDNVDDDTKTSTVTCSIGCNEVGGVGTSVIVEASTRLLSLSPLRDLTLEIICPLILGCCPRVAGSDPCYEPQASHSGLIVH